MDKGYIDIHCHLLPNVDDGASSMEETMEMMRMAYYDGIRTIIFTPHMKRPWQNVSNDEIKHKFEEAKERAKEIGEDLCLYLGSEIYYTHELMEKYSQKIQSINNTSYLLVEFSTDINFQEMVQAFMDMRNQGYEIILAHIERYECLVDDIEKVEHLYNMGVLLQMNAQTITKPMDYRQKKFVKRVLKEELIHFIATDAHGLKHRRPEMKRAVKLVSRKYGEEYAQALSYENAQKILQGKEL